MTERPLIVDIPGPCVSWKRTATDRNGFRRTPKDQREYQAWVRVRAMVARANHPAPPRLDERMSVRAYVCATNRQARDLDNAAKTLLDACNGVLWADDAQVDVLDVERLEPSKTEPRVLLVVEASTGLRTVSDLEQELGVRLGATAAQGRPQRGGRKAS